MSVVKRHTEFYCDICGKKIKFSRFRFYLLIDKTNDKFRRDLCSNCYSDMHTYIINAIRERRKHDESQIQS